MSKFSKTKVRRLNNRQCKKHHVGAYERLGFGIEIAFKKPMQEEDFDTFWDNFIGMVEEAGLTVNGLAGQIPMVRTDAVIFPEEDRTTKIEDRFAMLSILQRHPEYISEAWIGSISFDGHNDDWPQNISTDPYVIHITYAK